MDVDASNSDVGVKQSVDLSPNTRYVFRVVHKETGSAQPYIQIKRTNGPTLYYKNDGSGWQESQDGRALANRDSYYNSWIYFTTPDSVTNGVDDTFEFTISRYNDATSTSESIYIDEVVVIIKKELNDNFFVTVSSNAEWNENGMENMKIASMGDYFNASSLEPGKWFWEDEVVYYRLNSGETIDNIHIEIAQGGWTGGSALDCLYLTDASYIAINNIDVGFCQRYPVNIGGTTNNSILSGVSARYGDIAFLVGSNTAYNTFQYSIASNTHEHAWYDMGSDNTAYYNNVAYNTETDNGFSFYSVVTNGIFKNNISSNADANQFSLGPGGDLSISNNLYYGTINNFDGSNNIENQNPLFVDPDNFDFSLQSTSLAINAGIDVSLTTDYIETSVPQGLTPDIGAYEFLVPTTVPISLDQYDSDGINTVSSGGTVAPSSSFVFKFNMEGNNNPDSLTPEIEIRPVGTSFSNTATHTGSAVTYSGSTVEGSITVENFGSGSFHWQARVQGGAGATSWISFGGNSESDADFVVDYSTDGTDSCTTTSPLLPLAQNCSCTKYFISHTSI